MVLQFLKKMVTSQVPVFAPVDTESSVIVPVGVRPKGPGNKYDELMKYNLEKRNVCVG